jgi:asparagine synthase (glutamine-hydrolysing)
MMDRATMAASIEGRVPFIDVPLVEFCMSLSERTKLGRPRLQKRLLRRAISEWVPREIVRGRKSGMPSPFPAFMDRKPEVVRRLLLGSDSYMRGVLPSGWLERRLGDRDEMRRHAPILYALVVFEVWHRLFIVEKAYDRPNMSLTDLFDFPAPSVPAARDVSGRSS